MSDLSDFGAFDHVPPPRIQKQEPVPVPELDVTAGHLGPVPERDCWGFVKEADPDGGGRGHKYLDWPEDATAAFAVSESAWAQVRTAGAEVVLAVDHETGDVWEWRARSWDGQRVPKSKRWDYGKEWIDDPQVYATVDEAAHRWPDHADGVFIAEHVTVQGDYR